MTGFNKSDFENDEVRLKLLSIINDKLHFDVLKKFSNLNKRQQAYFNEEMNKYIQSLPEDGYLEVITKDFNKILHDVMTSEDFKPELYKVNKHNRNLIEVGKDETVEEVISKFESISV
jgi:UDP-galactopyranose mutase